jgi:hypothetical protein
MFSLLFGKIYEILKQITLIKLVNLISWLHLETHELEGIVLVIQLCIISKKFCNCQPIILILIYSSMNGIVGCILLLRLF